MKRLDNPLSAAPPAGADGAPGPPRRESSAEVIRLIVGAVLFIAVVSAAFWPLGGTLASAPAPLVPEYVGAAAALAVNALAVWAIYLRPPGRWARPLTIAALVAVTVSATAVWLGPLDAVTALDAIDFPGGPAPLIASLAAFGVTLISVALLLKMAGTNTALRIAAEICVLCAFLIGVSSIIVYAYGEDLIDPFLMLRRVRVPAALSITLLTVAIVVAEKHWAIHRVVRRMGWGAGLFFGVLFVLLTLTGLMWQIAQSDAKLQLATRFQSDVSTMRRLVESHLNGDIKALKGGSSLFAASEDVDRASWKAYVDGLNLEQDYPGVQGFGYAQVVPADQVTAVENAVRAEGFPDFTIFPLAPPRAVYTTIIYLLPFDARNQRAFGFDMFSEPVRHDAMARARDTGQPAMTRQVILLQEGEGDKQKGFLIYEPVYRRGSPTGDTAERVAAIEGYVYSPFRMKDFINASLGDQTFNINFEVYDQDPADPNALRPENLMYGTPPPAAPDSTPTATQVLTTGGHSWLLRFTATPAYATIQETRSRPQLVLYAGLLVSVALALATYFLASSRQRAVSIAGTLTEDLANERDAAVLEQQKDEMLLDGIIEAMVVFDRNGRIERINAAAEAMLGRDESELLGKHYSEALVAYDDHDQPIPLHDRPAAVALGSRHKIVNAVVYYRRSDGTTFPALLSVAPLIHNDELHGAIEVFRDISEERELDRAKDEFVSVASHQLRTPITAQSWLLDILGDGETVGPLTDQQSEIVQKLAKSNARLAELVTALLNVSRIESGRLTVAPVPTDLVELTDSVLEEVRVELEPRGHRVTVTAPPLPRVSVDPVLIRQVIINLLVNAAKYSPDGSLIEVSIELRGDHLTYTVRDHGYGIPIRQRAQVFSKFFRGENILHRQTDGNGLGLYLVKSLVEMSGGRIWFDSAEDHGTAFSFTLPLSGSPAREGEVSFGMAPAE
ncbi:CHASE domain-containing protein [Mycolicibacterium palauense]|uniref:CHASE domain-containing protein n=1 Tax=Mycolicibacterium palauense TaxID=2034511 RepID=UPI000BFEB6FF|nr:CHASE domain-containing protein [Mycolicibacterium palauense]